MNSKPVILFESYPDFNGSSLEIYNELLKRGYGAKYDMVWAVYDNFALPTDKPYVKLFKSNTFCQLNHSETDILKRTKLIIDSNRYIQKVNGAYRFHVRHGCCLKNSAAYNHNIGTVDGILTTSPEMLELDKKIFPENVRDKFVITGMPATDRLFSPANIYSNGFIKSLTGSDRIYSKIIGWLPTFRDHRLNKVGTNRFPFGLPAIHSLDEYRATNEVLKSNNMLLIVQMHHAQAKNYQVLPNVSNIRFVNETIKSKYHVATTDILGNCDALLTDYSSAYHEYIILNRPIGLCVEDIVEYATSNGFFCYYPDWIKGDYILRNEHLNAWLNSIAHGMDIHKADREASLAKIHKFKDNKSTERVVNYLIQEAKL